MPNYCGNILSVRGAADELRRFREENSFKGSPKKADIRRGNIMDVCDEAERAAKPLSFEMHLPTPKEFAGKPSPPPEHRSVENELTKLLAGEIPPYDWYTWRLKNWGTKWDLRPDIKVMEDYEDGLLQYDFDTAWSPPCAWLVSVSAKYPDLTFHLQYEESGCDFEGYIKIVNGEAVEEKEGSYTRCYLCGRRGCGCTPEQKRGQEE